MFINRSLRSLTSFPEILVFAVVLTLDHQPAFGQGTVDFSAGQTLSTRIATNNPFATGGGSSGYIQPFNSANPISPFNYYFALFVAPTNITSAFHLFNPLLDGFALVSPPYGTNGPGLGGFNGNPDSSGVIVPGYLPGSPANFVVVGWSSNLGSTWAEFNQRIAMGTLDGGLGYMGESGVATGIMLRGSPGTPARIFGTGPGQISGFTLIALPEPSVAALAILAGLLIRLAPRSQRRLNPGPRAVPTRSM